MTITATTNRWSYTGDGTTVDFDFTEPAFEAAFLTVFVDGVAQPSANYAVANVGEPNGGTVTFGTAPASGATVVIERSVPATQPDTIREGGPFPSGLVQRALDRLAAAIVDRFRVVVTQVSSAATSISELELPDYAPGALLGWGDSAGVVQDASPGPAPDAASPRIADQTQGQPKTAAGEQTSEQARQEELRARLRDPANNPYLRRDGEGDKAWSDRLLGALMDPEIAPAEALLINWTITDHVGSSDWGRKSDPTDTGLPPLPETEADWAKFERQQGVLPNAHESARPAHPSDQEAYEKVGLKGNMESLYFVGRDGNLYFKTPDVVDESPVAGPKLLATSRALMAPHLIAYLGRPPSDESPALADAAGLSDLQAQLQIELHKLLVKAAGGLVPR